MYDMIRQDENKIVRGEKIRSCCHSTFGLVLFPLSDEEKSQTASDSPRPTHWCRRTVSPRCCWLFRVVSGYQLRQSIHCRLQQLSNSFPRGLCSPTIDAATVADLLVNEIIARHGAPPTLLSDRGSNFLSSLVKEVCYLMDTKKVFTTFYHPQYVMGLWRDLTALSPRAFQCASAVTRKIGTNSWTQSFLSTVSRHLRSQMNRRFTCDMGESHAYLLMFPYFHRGKFPRP